MAISDAIRAEVETISDDPDSEISLTLDELVAGVKKAYENTYKGRFDGPFDVTLDGHSPDKTHKGYENFNLSVKYDGKPFDKVTFFGTWNGFINKCVVYENTVTEN
jgi:hypothetical protein